MASIASDVIREIRENPDVREEVRRLILTDELLAMPALLARMDSRQDQMAELLVQQGESLDRMDARQDRMEETQSRIAELLVQQGEHLDRMDAAHRTGWTRAKIGRKGARIGWKRFRAGQALFWIV